MLKIYVCLTPQRFQKREPDLCIKLNVNSESVGLNHSGRDINQKRPTAQLPAPSIQTMPASAQIPKRNLSALNSCSLWRNTGWRVDLQGGPNRISCCFITASPNQCHHMLLLAQRRGAPLVPGRQLQSKRAKMISEYVWEVTSHFPALYFAQSAHSLI